MREFQSKLPGPAVVVLDLFGELLPSQQHIVSISELWSQRGGIPGGIFRDGVRILVESGCLAFHVSSQGPELRLE